MGRERFINVDRETPMLLPPDLRDWVKEDDLANFILEAVNGVNLSVARTNARGTGSAQYPPAMMLAVLIYCYATGTFSSRQIEALTHRHVSVRYLAGNLHPDHDTICKFRRENEALLKATFARVLQLAAALDLCRVGTVCLDGTKILADAAKRRTFNQEQLQTMQQRLELEIAELVAKAEKADQEPDEDGTKLPERLRGRQRLRDQVIAAQAVLEEQVAQRYEEREAERAAWKTEPMGECPRKRSSKPGENDRINLTDPESGALTQKGGGCAQSYNAQLAVSGERLAIIMATSVCTQANDRQQLEPMARKTVESAAGLPLNRIAVDTGFDHPRQIHIVEEELGMEVVCPPQPPPPQKTVPPESAAAPESTPSEGTPAAPAPRCKRKRKPQKYRLASQELRARMGERARSPEGQHWMRMRKTTVEPVFGHIKSTIGFRRFRLRGLKKVNLEWQLVAVAFNCRRLCHLHTRSERSKR